MKEMYKKILIIVGIIVALSFFVTLVFTYVFRINAPILTVVRNTLRLPAIIVDGEWISLAEIEENTDAIKQFYENQDFSTMGIRIDFNTDDGQRRLKMQEKKMINKLVEDAVIKKIADDWEIVISDESVKTSMERPMEELNSKEDVKKRLEKLYGWSLDDFGEKVVRDQLLKEKMNKKFEMDNAVTDEMQAKIDNAKKELDDGRDFAEVAKKYSEGASASDGGVMGWFADNQLQDEIGKEIFAMQKGEYTDVIETSLGLHIVKVNEVGEEDGQKYVHTSQIIIKKQMFVDYLNEVMKGINVKVFLPEYKWDSQSAMIVFVDDELINFENEVYENAQNTVNELFVK